MLLIGVRGRTRVAPVELQLFTPQAAVGFGKAKGTQREPGDRVLLEAVFSVLL